MPSIQQHMIRRQLLHVEVYGAESDGAALQHRLPELCRSSLSPAIEQAMMGVVPAHEHLIIERIDIDAGMLELEHLERDLAEVVAQALAKQLRAQVLLAGAMSEGMQRRSSHQSVHEALLHFLRTGNLPWWFHLPVGKTLEQVIRGSWKTVGQTAATWSHFVYSLSDALRSDPVQQRLVRQFSPEFLEVLLISVSATGAATLRAVAAKLQSIDDESVLFRCFTQLLWQRAFVAATSGKELTEAALVAECLNSLTESEWQESRWVAQIAKHWPEKLSDRIASRVKRANADAPRVRKRGQQSDDEDESRRQQPRADSHLTSIAVANTVTRAREIARSETIAQLELNDGIYVDCAGVVLLHPFLPPLFDTLGIAAEDKMLQPERALCLLHFLATGQRVAPEYALVLPKLLCDVALDAPVDSLLELSAADADEVAALLAAVIRHWNALGDISVDSLRGTFLVRPGKLSHRADGDFVLQVESQSFDILLNRLPWGIGAIKLPWMHVMLWVEWH